MAANEGFKGMARERVLVVDDEPDVLQICERILTAEGFSVTTVSNGFEAVQLAGAERFDLLLTDIKMPGMDGLDVAEAARSVNPNLVCVTMTGYSTMDTAIEALKLGVEEFIIKPFSASDLVSAIGRALEKERLRREAARLRALLPLFDAMRTFMSSTDVQEVAQKVVDTAARELRAQRAAIFLWMDRAVGLRPQEIVALHEVQAADLPAWRELARAALDATSPITFGRAQPHPALAPLGVAAALAQAIPSKAGPLGVLVLAHERPDDPFSEGDKEFATLLCSQAGIAIENANLFEELREAYEELRQLDHLKSEFISIAAHELRTPLAILMGYAGILEGLVPPEVKKYASIISRSANKLRTLIDAMLNLDALEKGTSTIRLESFSLAELVEDAVEDLRPLAQSKKQTLQVRLPAHEVRLITDREKFNMILTNLLSNAVKFTPEGGTITVSALQTEEGIQVSVADTGPGIPRELWSRIFERFFQAEPSLTRQHEGMGLGLSIARGMVELFGGRIWLESEVGKGSTFFFSLPLSPLKRG